jgi:outer membrane receptor for monomeric catechols
MVQLAACNRAYGWPAPAVVFGTGSPEAAVTGYYPGMLYADTENSKLYAFFGTAGENTGWEILN